ncbi:hypothetical protein H4R19_000031 [Coemansia spiralis]|nr:hypothetical protein H4R19_000031 [Coemansia spiralis]
MAAFVPSTQADVRELASRAANGDPRCARAPPCFQQDTEEGRVELLPEAAAVLRAPADVLTPEHVRSNISLAGSSLAAYNRHAARTHLRCPDRLPANTECWRKGWVPAAEPTDWKAVHKTPLEPKHVSLLWKLRHGCVPTAKTLYHGIPDGTPNCPVCFNLTTDNSGLLPAPNDREDLAHYFYNCARV